jgi:hypothetical protein
MSSLLEQTSFRPLFEKTLMIEIHETYFETPKAQKGKEPPKPIQREKFMFRAKFSILDAIKYAQEAVFMVYLLDNKKRVKGKFYLQNFSLKSHYSFVDLYITNSLNIVPIVAVDFSLANLTFDES